MIALILEVTPIAVALTKKLKDLNLSVYLFSKHMEDFYRKWSKEYHKSYMKPPQDENAWSEFFDALDIEGDEERKTIVALVSKFPEGQKCFGDGKFNIIAMEFIKHEYDKSKLNIDLCYRCNRFIKD